MAQVAPSLLRPTFPSVAQAALAVVIIKSKPPDKPVREYVLQLRAQVKHGQHPLDAAQPNQYLDLVAYWHEQYMQAQKECNELRSLNIKLERSNHRLSSQFASTTELEIPSKRKAPITASGKRPKRSKQTHTRTMAQNTVVDTQEGIEEDSEFLDGLSEGEYRFTHFVSQANGRLEEGAELTKCLFITHRLCRATDADAETLCSSLAYTASAVGKVIHNAAQNYDRLTHKNAKIQGSVSLEQDKSDFGRILMVCARAFMSILVGMDKLVDNIPESRLPSLIICGLVDMFKSALYSIKISAQHTAHNVFQQHADSKHNKENAPADIVKNSAPARALSHLLISFLGLLEKTNPVHQKIFDGFVFTLFEVIGKQLYYCTFGHHRSTSIEGNFTPVSEDLNTQEIIREPTEALALRFEMKALILVLERAMGLAPNHMNSQSTRISKTADQIRRTLSVKSLPTASRSRLNPLAKDRLQRTLMACMYGNKTDDEFIDVLTKPMPSLRLGNLKTSAKFDETDIGLWYKQEVWRLVGWDILTREGGW